MAVFSGLLRDQNGDAAIQYALVAALLSLVTLAASLALREPTLELYADIGVKTEQALTAAPDPVSSHPR